MIFRVEIEDIELASNKWVNADLQCAAQLPIAEDSLPDKH